jgi:hypothetical protein
MGMYKCVSNHTEDLTGGRTLAPGDYAEVDEKDEHNAARIEAGALIPVPDDVRVPDDAPVDEGPAEATTEPGATDESTQAAADKPDEEETDTTKDKGKNKLSVAPPPQGEAAGSDDKGSSI